MYRFELIGGGEGAVGGGGGAIVVGEGILYEEQTVGVRGGRYRNKKNEKILKN
jgi:hypothetical protein